MPQNLSRRAFIFGAPLMLAGCAAEPVWAPQSAIDARRFIGSGPPSLTVFTVKNTGSDNGAHTALLIDASERVLFDPAGSFRTSVAPERNDVLFGFSPAVEQAYVSFHARTEYYVISQKIPVAAGTAAQALQLAKANGAVPKANCTRATSGILRQLPGFDDIGTTWFPNNLSDIIARRTDVTTREFREQD